MQDSMISRVGLVIITLVLEFHMALVVDVDENGFREWNQDFITGWVWAH